MILYFFAVYFQDGWSNSTQNTMRKELQSSEEAGFLSELLLMLCAEQNPCHIAGTTLHFVE